MGISFTDTAANYLNSAPAVSVQTFTLGAWFYCTDLSQTNAVFAFPNTAGDELLAFNVGFSGSPTAGVFSLGDGSQLAATTNVLTESKLHYVSWTVGSGTITTMLDGDIVNMGSDTYTVLSELDRFVIGANDLFGGIDPMNGSIFEFHMHDSVLTNTERQELAAGADPEDYSGLVHRGKFTSAPLTVEVGPTVTTNGTVPVDNDMVLNEVWSMYIMSDSQYLNMGVGNVSPTITPQEALSVMWPVNMPNALDITVDGDPGTDLQENLDRWNAIALQFKTAKAWVHITESGAFIRSGGNPDLSTPALYADFLEAYIRQIHGECPLTKISYETAFSRLDPAAGDDWTSHNVAVRSMLNDLITEGLPVYLVDQEQSWNDLIAETGGSQETITGSDDIHPDDRTNHMTALQLVQDVLGEKIRLWDTSGITSVSGADKAIVLDVLAPTSAAIIFQFYTRLRRA